MPLHQEIRLVARSVDYELIGFRDLVQAFEVSTVRSVSLKYIDSAPLRGLGRFFVIPDPKITAFANVLDLLKAQPSEGLVTIHKVVAGFSRIVARLRTRVQRRPLFSECCS